MAVLCRSEGARGRWLAWAAAWPARADIPSTSPAAATSTSCSRRTGSHHAPVTTPTSSRRGVDSWRGDSRHRSRRRSSRSSRGPRRRRARGRVRRRSLPRDHRRAVRVRGAWRRHRGPGHRRRGAAIPPASVGRGECRSPPAVRRGLLRPRRVSHGPEERRRVPPCAPRRWHPPGRGTRSRRPHRAAHGDPRRRTLARPRREHPAELRAALHARRATSASATSPVSIRVRSGTR